MLANKGVVAAILKTLRRTSNNGISLAPFTSASNNDFKIRSTDETADGTHHRTSSVAESLKEGAVKAMETGLNVGEKAKQNMDEAFDAAKETTKNVKDAVVDDHANDAMRKGYPHTDSHTESLRERATGYDLRDRN
ncbi:PREDICTED: uncharacterized protein LOC109230440 [Nicotiana attenuata]|uniref:Uncharacterized protein n=1 Tax=Nicotiana attenuata TaxID=49451 RepID=A0A1J6IIM6_NICAT|nr:PREDICTED: uncharacterized protein LOC109230440 [Nicotiana attenuata]OIT00376.1 hypothetical protein A4A49_35243 [Nicotiana attenuata]